MIGIRDWELSIGVLRTIPKFFLFSGYLLCISGIIGKKNTMKPIVLVPILCSILLSACSVDPGGTTRSATAGIGDVGGGIFSGISIDSQMVSQHNAIIVVPKGEEIVLGSDSVIGIDIVLPTLDNNSVEYADLGNQSLRLASETGGIASSVKTVSEITDQMIEILDARLTDNTDLVFMIDVTGSMGDDIENVKLGATAILDKARSKNNVRVAVATYGDHRDGSHWFNYIPLSTNYAYVKSYILTLSANAGGGDWPESMFDAACLVMDNMEWNESSQKMILVLGDAPSLVPPQSNHGIDDVIAKSKEHGVFMNYYPVIVSPFPLEEPGPVFKYDVPMVANIFPVPSAGNLTVQLSKEAEYKWQVFSQNGMLIKEDAGFTSSIALDLSGQANGVYIVKIINEEALQVEEKRIVIAH